MPPARAPLDVSVADKLHTAGLISKIDRDRAVERAKADDGRIEEALIEVGALGEKELLEHLAQQHEVEALSTQQLHDTPPNDDARSMVSRVMADRHGIFPLRFDQGTKQLEVATGNPGNTSVAMELTLTTSAKKVKRLVARPAAVEAAIARGYDGQQDAFELLLSADNASQQPGGSTKPDPADESEAASDWSDLFDDMGDEALSQPAPTAKKSKAKSRAAKKKTASSRAPDSATPSSSKRGAPDSATPRSSRSGVSDSATPPSSGSGMPDSATPSSARGSRPGSSRSRSGGSSWVSFPRPSLLPSGSRHSMGVLNHPQSSMDQLAEVARVFVGLIEQTRPNLAGHSALVARLAGDASELMGLPPSDRGAIVLASYLHDLGKGGGTAAGGGTNAPSGPTPHLTALNVGEFRVYRQLAERVYDLPVQLVESATLAAEVLRTVELMYERYDGKGLPDGLSGDDIPIGARVLAVADSFADLTRNPKNTYDKLLDPDVALDNLRKHSNTLFDPKIIEVFARASRGEHILTQLLDERHRVLLVDPDTDHTLVLQLRLSDAGFEVHIARDTTEALAKLAHRRCPLVVSEINLERPGAGLKLCEKVIQAPDGDGIGWVFLSRAKGAKIVQEAFHIGAIDYITKPAPADVVVAKLLRRLEDEANIPSAREERGVSGSLADMGMTDVIQVLFHGRKTGALRVEWPEYQGEIHFVEGRIVQATISELVGEKAVYAMLGMDEDGTFTVDPHFIPSGEPTIHGSPEGLLLEGMRLLDEGLSPKPDGTS